MKGNLVENTVSIYALLDPRTFAIRYIGCTVNPEARLRTHIYQAKVDRPAWKMSHTIHWIKELVQEDLEPIMVVLFECEDSERKNAEPELIKRFVDAGVPLTNTEHNPKGIRAMERYLREMAGQWAKQNASDNYDK